jgi:hypothetical protein
MKPGGGVLVFAVAAAVVLCGCSTILAVRAQSLRADENPVVSGTVAIEQPARGQLFVGILARDASGFDLVDHFVSEKPGRWIFALAPGTYWLAACEDVNGDGRYENEPALTPNPDEPLVLAPGQSVEGIHLVIPQQGRFEGSFTVADLQTRDPAEQQRVSAFKMSVAGAVATLDDPRFDPDVGVKGMWQYYGFLLETQPGIYFLQPYDPKNIPVLFVHGIGGTPRDFQHLIAELDSDRFQPWVYHYPSGAGLDALAELLVQLFAPPATPAIPTRPSCARTTYFGVAWPSAIIVLRCPGAKVRAWIHTAVREILSHELYAGVRQYGVVQRTRRVDGTRTARKRRHR